MCEICHDMKRTHTHTHQLKGILFSFVFFLKLSLSFSGVGKIILIENDHQAGAAAAQHCSHHATSIVCGQPVSVLMCGCMLLAGKLAVSSEVLVVFFFRCRQVARDGEKNVLQEATTCLGFRIEMENHDFCQCWKWPHLYAVHQMTRTTYI